MLIKETDGRYRRQNIDKGDKRFTKEIEEYRRFVEQAKC
jgi:hypothetical protein